MIRRVHCIVAPIVLVATSALVACAHEHAVAPVVPTTEPVSVTHTTSHTAPTPQSGIHVSEELRACQLDVNNIDTAPKFDFDKADLRPDERSLVASVAKCVTTGPLSSRFACSVVNAL